ncbi:MAG: DUF3426 domain-containing protein [Gammaproteobacteria bacterium]|nr:DUF3426 domain-containing protein [Gammaproteobacteria bacterium]
MHTQCPECKTRFRVNDDQLRAAQGQVRCSRCHIAFNALEFLRAPEDNPPAGAPEIEETATDRDFLSNMDEFSDLKAQISDDLCPFEDSETITPPAEPENNVDNELSDVLRELEEFELNTRQQTAATPLSETETPELDEPVTLDLAEIEAAEPAVAFKNPGLQDQLLMDDILGNKTPAKQSSSVWWSIGILTLLLLALSQLSWFGRDKLMHYPEGRMLLENACNLMGCGLPTIRAPEQIQVLSRSITSHPKVESALLIQLTIANKANFSQPYPVLQISLYSSEELLVVQRRFKPDEYLTNNSTSGQLDPGRALYVELEINDPGDDVTGFKLEFF